MDIRRFVTQIAGKKAIPWYLAGGVPAANCVAAYKPIGAIDIAASYINIANPGTYDLTAPSPPAFDAAVGWTFDGIANYLVTGITNGAAQSWSAVIKFASMTNNGRPFGSYDGGYGFFIIPDNAGNAVTYINGGNTGLAKTPKLLSGTLGIAGANAFRNSMQEAGTITAAAGSGRSIYIGCMHYLGTPGTVNFFAGSISHIAFYNTDITAYMPRVMESINPT